jgi:ABC-2 type transport system permease protein
LRSRSLFGRLLGKELRELSASRAYWLCLIVTGALVGHAFIDATALYAEASGAGGGPSALAQGLNPLTGIVVPTLGAYDLVATLLFPFVVIRMFAAEREAGALPLLLQAPVSFSTIVATKGMALIIGWLIIGVPGLIALDWWRAIGGHLALPETLTVVSGHFLRGLMTIGIGAACAALARGASSAAIAALSVTLGAWAIDYAAAAKGGWFRLLAQYTPEAALRVFEQGELRLSVVTAMVAVGAVGLAMAWQWLRVGRTLVRRAEGVALSVVLLGLVGFAAARVRNSADLSEDRRNSFSVADERALTSITAPLTIRVNLAAEDPRLADLERGVFAKLRRILPNVSVEYVARSRSGLFAAAGEHYGEVWYEINGRRVMSRSATEEIVLETIYQAAGMNPPAAGVSNSYPGYPLTTIPKHAALVFFFLWPIVVVVAWWALHRTPSPLKS